MNQILLGCLLQSVRMFTKSKTLHIWWRMFHHFVSLKSKAHLKKAWMELVDVRENLGTYISTYLLAFLYTVHSRLLLLSCYKTVSLQVVLFFSDSISDPGVCVVDYKTKLYLDAVVRHWQSLALSEGLCASWRVSQCLKLHWIGL